MIWEKHFVNQRAPVRGLFKTKRLPSIAGSVAALNVG
jgi:hypothetical protein